MLEKIGLPPKPSLRGNNWVVDATHCQGCSSQFSFINRKHHCRRCGGLFCNSCTQQRMLLRGQGNSSVRICEPCKKLEEAARFEMRHGHKNKAGRGGFNLVSKHEEELLNEIMNDDKRESVLSGRESVLSTVSNIQQGTSSASCSNIKETTNQDEGREFRSLSVDVQNHVLTEMGSATSEELRQEASDQKKKYKILKAQGKSEEALKSFKRGKELERQADALELHLRKNRRRTLSSNNVTELQKVKENSQELGRKTKLPLEKDKEKDNLASELKELGWSDMDLHASDKRSADMTLESELSTILGERSKKVKSTGKGSDSVEKSQVIAHKKKALALKREGKLDEAKEELKKAKVLEKKIEEQELLGDDEDSDEEFSALMHSMDIDKKDDLSISYDGVPSFDFNNVVGIPNDLDGNFEVTEEDMDDPELAATLKSLGWTEETAQSEDVGSHLNREALLGEIQSLKREAVYKKRAGNAAQAMELLKKAKQLERDLDSSASQGTNSMTQVAGKTSKINSSDVGNANGRKDMAPSPEPKSKLIIQKELLGLKKRALALRREGRLDEADEELKKGMIFERQLEEMNNTSEREVSPWDGGSKNAHDSTDLDVGDEGDMTDQEMCDPTYLSILKSLGWKEEGNDSVPLPPYIETDGHVNDMKINNSSVSGVAVSGNQVLQSRSKSEIQRELLALKRKAIALRRQGKAEEDEEVLKLAALLETQLTEVDGPERQAVPAKFSRQPEHEITKFSLQNAIEEADEGVLSEEDMHDPELISMLNNLGWKDDEAMKVQAKSSGQTSRNPVSSDAIVLANFAQELPVATPKRSKMEIQRELLGLKRKALSLRRQGKTEEAEEVLRMAKALEAQLEDVQMTNKQPLSDGSKQQERKIGSLSPDEKQGPLNDVVVGNEISVQAMMEPNKAVDQPEGLGRENGKGKSLLKTLDISSPETSPPIEHNHQLLVDLGPSPQIRSTEGTGVISPSGQTAKIVDLLTGESWSSSQSDQNVEQKSDVSSVNSFNTDFHVPIDSQNVCLVDFRNKDKVTNESKQQFVHASEKPSINDLNRLQVAASQNDGSSLQQDILAHKRKAVALKRQGKLAEAKEELRQAKALEKKLEKSNVQPIPSSSDVSSFNVAAGEQQQQGLSYAPKPLSSRDRFKLQQESLKHKRQALKLRREGQIQEAEAEFELAKSLETQLEDSSADKPVADVTVEDFLDPQLLSALKAIGLEDDSYLPQNTHKPVSVPETIAKVESSNEDRIQLEERIKEERIKAVNLKRLGKQAEALEALRQAKLFEKKLNSLIAK